MSTRLYVGNLSFNTTRDELQDLFSTTGFVQEATVVQDRETGTSQAFAFVMMSSEQRASNAIAQLNGRDFQGCNLLVSEARPPARSGAPKSTSARR